MLPLMDVQEAAKCAQSPTGKHHWMIPELGVHPTGICKFCSKERQFNNSAGDGNWDPKNYHSRSAGSVEEFSRFTPNTW